MNNMEILSSALNFIENNLNEEITADDVSKACYCSKSSLQKIFKYLCGYSIKEYIIKRRITKAAGELVKYPDISVLDIAVKYGYCSNEAFTRSFEAVWQCTPSVFRKQARFTELHPKMLSPTIKGEKYMRNNKNVDISGLYDFMKERIKCYFICCDIKAMEKINEISRKTGDMAILELLKRLEEAASEDDVIFRIGGDEFVILTSSEELSYAENISSKIQSRNGEAFICDERHVPLSIHTSIARYEEETLQYYKLFDYLHDTIENNK